MPPHVAASPPERFLVGDSTAANCLRADLSTCRGSGRRNATGRRRHRRHPTQQPISAPALTNACGAVFALGAVRRYILQLMRPLILVSNDDGYRSAGIRALARRLADLGDVIVVAP